MVSPVGINLSGNTESGINSPDKSRIKEETARVPLNRVRESKRERGV